jgi:hypothetical protein
MANIKQHNNINDNQMFCMEITKEQTDVLARRLLPEIKKFFANEDIRKEFEEWKKLQNNDNHN